MGLNDGFLLLAVDRPTPMLQSPTCAPDFHKGPNLSRPGDEVDLVSIPRPIAERTRCCFFDVNDGTRFFPTATFGSIHTLNIGRGLLVLLTFPEPFQQLIFALIQYQLS